MRTISFYRAANRIREYIFWYSQRKKSKKIIHFLHIGKTGGTSIKFALRNFIVDEEMAIFLHRHSFKLRNVPEGEKVFFFLRDPVGRFISAFYSRKREGRPRIYVPWSRAEKKAFSKFQTPNDLALALDAGGLDEQQAIKAMRGIGHIKDNYWNWFDSPEYLNSRIGDVILVGFQESLDEDFSILKTKLRLPLECKLPTDSVNTHRSPDGVNKHLDLQAIENLKKWYESDYKLISFLKMHFKHK